MNAVVSNCTQRISVISIKWLRQNNLGASTLTVKGTGLDINLGSVVWCDRLSVEIPYGVF